MAFCAECGRSLRGSPDLGSSGSDQAGPLGLPGPPHLVGVEGSVQGVDYVLNKPKVTIGRLPDCDISIPDAGVSRLHAWIRTAPDVCTIEDGGSANGTWVNGVQASPSLPLSDHDVVRIGTCSFVFQLEQPSALPPGSMTMVADVGAGPNVFGDNQSDLTPDDSGRPQGSSISSSPWPPEWLGSAPVESAPEEPESRPSRPAPRAAGPGEPSPLEAQVEALRGALTAVLQRVDELASTALGAGADQARRDTLDRALKAVLDDPAARDAPERYRDLQALLGRLRAGPTDLKLLLELSNNVTTLSDIVEAYLRALGTLRDLAPR